MPKFDIKTDNDYIRTLRSLGFGYRGIAEELYLKTGVRVSYVTIKNRLDGTYWGKNRKV